MRILTLATAVALLAAACGGAAQPAPTTAPAATTAAPSPTATATAAATATAETTVTFTAELKTENEVPPIANEERTGSGTATVVFELTRDASGKITAATADFEIELMGFPTTTAINVAHIHKAAAGANGPVAVGIKTDGANPIALTSGSTTITETGVMVEPDVAQQILDDPSGYYVNVHSAANGGGVVRGQLEED